MSRVFEPSPWRSTRFAGQQSGISRALVTSESLTVVLEFNRLLARLLRRPPRMESMRTGEVVDLRLIDTRMRRLDGSRRQECLVVGGSGYARRAMRLSPWVYDAWLDASPELDRRFRSSHR